VIFDTVIVFVVGKAKRSQELFVEFELLLLFELFVFDTSFKTLFTKSSSFSLFFILLLMYDSKLSKI